MSFVCTVIIVILTRRLDIVSIIQSKSIVLAKIVGGLTTMDVSINMTDIGAYIMVIIFTLFIAMIKSSCHVQLFSISRLINDPSGSFLFKIHGISYYKSNKNPLNPKV